MFGNDLLNQREGVLVFEDSLQPVKVLECELSMDSEPRLTLLALSGYSAKLMSERFRTKMRQTYGFLPKSSPYKYDLNNPQIKKVIFNDPATIVIWSDDSKTVVKCQPGDTYSKELGLAMCISKKYLGNKGNFNEEFKKWIPDDSEAVLSYKTLWDILKEKIAVALQEGKDCGYDNPKSTQYDKFYIYQHIDNIMRFLEEKEV